MIFLQEVMFAFSNQISSGSPYLWNCFGENMRYLDFGDDNGFDSKTYGSCVFNAVNNRVVCIEFFNNKEKAEKAYRWIDPEFIEVYKKEAEQRGVNPNTAYDELEFQDLSAIEIFTQIKADNGNLIEEKTSLHNLEIDEDVLVQVEAASRARNITAHEMMYEILYDVVKNPEKYKQMKMEMDDETKQK